MFRRRQPRLIAELLVLLFLVVFWWQLTFNLAPFGWRPEFLTPREQTAQVGGAGGASQLAFPGAAGVGAYAKGGRGWFMSPPPMITLLVPR